MGFKLLFSDLEDVIMYFKFFNWYEYTHKVYVIDISVVFGRDCYNDNFTNDLIVAMTSWKKRYKLKHF